MFIIGYVGSVGMDTQMSQSLISLFVSPSPSLPNSIAILFETFIDLPSSSGLIGILDKL